MWDLLWRGRRSSSAERSPTRRVWTLTGFVCLAASAVAFIVDFDKHPSTETLPWWAIMLAYGLVEILVVHIQFRREAYTFSFGEVVLVLGLIYSSPEQLLLGQVLGHTIALVVVRRQSLLKLGFNVANSVLNTLVALACFQLLGSVDDGLDAANWPALLVASLAFVATNTALIGWVVSLIEGVTSTRNLVTIAAFGLAGATVNASLALTGAVAVKAEPWSGLLLGVIGMTLLAASKAFASEREQFERLESLESASATLGGSLGDAVAGVLEHACRTFRCANAGLVIFPSDDGEPGWQASIPQETKPLVSPMEPEHQAAWIDLAAELDDARLVADSAFGGPVEDAFRAIGYRDGMVVRMVSEDRTIGLLLVGNRTTNVTALSSTDLRLLRTIGANAAAAFQRERLEATVQELVAVERTLSHEAMHDPLTGLPNRRSLQRTLETVVDGRAGNDCSLLFLDLDGFKAVNDELGHTSGDEVLQVVARRLLGCLRSDDVACRLGGDEFAVFTTVAGEHATDLAQRILAAVSRPATVSGGIATVGCSVGIASTSPGTRTEDLVRIADEAMYAAKRAGKGQVVVARAR